MKKYVIIGNSAAGIGAVEGIRRIDAKGEITVITNEPYHTYSRPLISYLLLGKVTEEKMKYRADSFYDEHGCKLVHETAALIDSAAKQVILSKGSRIPYDKLLAATGSLAVIPPFEGLGTVKDKTTFMSLDDAKKLDKMLGADKHVLIVGAGLIGLKCAEGIIKKAARITVLDIASGILPNILDDGGAKLVLRYLKSKGIVFALNAKIKRFDGNNAVLESEDKINFDILVLASGVRPNTALLDKIADIKRGILINERSETSAPDIYAAGDCAEALDVSSGKSRVMALLPNAYMQGECAGINMAGGDKIFDKAIPMNAVGFFGLHIVTAGSYDGEVYEEGTDGTDGDKTGEVRYKRLFYKDNALNGYILIGDVEKAGIYTSLIRERTPLDTIDFPLICEKPGLMAFTQNERSAKLGGINT